MRFSAILALCLLLAACSGSTTNPDDVALADTPEGTDDTPGGDDDPGIIDDDDDDEPPVVPPGSAQLAVLSNRPDLVSAGDVLVEVLLGDPEDRDELVLLHDGNDVTDVLEPVAGSDARLFGLVQGLSIGDNTLAVNLGNTVTVTNHPIGGPVFTGPQIQPWDCQDTAVDAQCNQDVAYAFEYKSSNPDSPGLQPYDPDNPPDDVAMTTTTGGETLPFIVRREIGYMARDRYEIKTLFRVGEDWTAANPQPQWNGRLLVTHGGNCRGEHDTSTPRFVDYAGTIPENPAIENSYVTALGLGWSVLSTAQLNLGHNCNLSYQAESLMMVKERYVEQYGPLRYTVGTGCSGGAITQNMIANAYPGLYNGLLTTCTYPDVMSTATQFADYHILLRYFQNRVAVPEEPETPEESFDQLPDPNPANNVARDGTVYSLNQQNAVYGHPNGIVNASLADDELFSEAVDPQSDCEVPAPAAGDPDTRYHPEINPGGARCDVLTFMENMVGARDRLDPDGNDTWSQNEIDLGEGFAGFPLGNDGVQYGLIPLQQGIITPEQFVALNTEIGGVDTDLNLTEVRPDGTRARLRPDTPALPNAYRAGILNTIVNMDTVPIINMTGPDPGIAHDSVHGYWLRYRFEREFPDVTREQSNFVMWGGPTPLIGDPNYMNESLLAMTAWLDAIEADTSDTPLAEKIRNNKPASVTDQCSNGSGETVRNEMCTEQEMAVYGTPRTEARGTPDDLTYIHGDMVQCQLRPFSRSDNYGAGNNFGLGNGAWDLEPDGASWALLESVFENGVCDYSQRAVGWTETVTWLRYQDVVGALITGGEQMPPAEYPRGWARPAFSGAWAPGFNPSE